MKRTFLLVLAFVQVGCASQKAMAPAESSSPGSTTAALRPRMELTLKRIRQDPRFTHALLGVLVEDEAGRSLFEENAELLMTPASVRKLFVAATVAGCIGLDATLPTELWLDGQQSGSTFFGNVILKGNGDPSLGGRYEDDRDLRLRPFVEALRARGILEVKGSMVADVSRYARELLPGSWKLGNVGSTYAAPVDALAFNENVVGINLTRPCETRSITVDPSFVKLEDEIACAEIDSITTDVTSWNVVRVEGTLDGEPDLPPFTARVAIQQPGLYAAHALQDLLERNGITFSDPVALSTQPLETGEKLVAIQSPFVFQLLGTVLRNSQNLYAEMLLRDTVNTLNRATIKAVSFEDAASNERDFLTRTVGIDSNEFSFADGSGLSPDNMVTSKAVLHILKYLDEPGRRGTFESLAAAPAAEGTLRKRLLPLAGRMIGKTGTVARVNALAGVVQGPNGDRRRFVVLFNNHTASSDEAEQAIDEIVMDIATF